MIEYTKVCPESDCKNGYIKYSNKGVFIARMCITCGGTGRVNKTRVELMEEYNVTLGDLGDIAEEQEK